MAVKNKTEHSVFAVLNPDATLAMTAAQSMNRDRLCHSELVSESQTNSRQTLKRVQGDSCAFNDSSVARRLGFNPTLSHAAFSLVEMLMALLVASLLMAALAPVMTKKVQEDVQVSGLGSIVLSTGKTVYNAPGTYSFIVPDGVYELRIQAAAGGAGRGGTQGGTYQSPKGQDATQYGYGGGGGACSQEVIRKADGSVDIEKTCYPGGRGGSNYAKLTFRLASAGSGGGAGGAVGLNNKGERQYLRLKVQPKDVISITVGKGGNGGGIGRGGENGGDTIIEIKNNRKIVFKGGKGGLAGGFQNITVDSTSVSIAGETAGGLGGNYPDFEDFNKKNDGTYKEVVAPVTSAVSTRGYAGSTDIGGYSGGEGGTTILGSKGGCGGKQQSADGNDCNIDDINGTDAISYNPVSNQNGGAGGGGGGIDPEAVATNAGGLGIGGAGASGYVVIEWPIASE